MEPAVVAPGQLRQPVQLVDAAGVGGAGDADDAAGLQTRRPRPRSMAASRASRSMRKSSSVGQLAQLAAAEPQQVDGLVEAVVGLAGDVEGRAGPSPAPAASRLSTCERSPAQRPVDGQLQAGDVGQRAAVGRGCRSCSPADRTGRTASGSPASRWPCPTGACRQEAAFWFMAAAQGLGEDRHRQRRRVHHAEVAAAADGHGVGEDPGAAVLHQLRRSGMPSSGRASANMSSMPAGRERSVDAAPLQALEVLHDQIDHGVAHLAQCRRSSRATRSGAARSRARADGLVRRTAGRSRRASGSSSRRACSRSSSSQRSSRRRRREIPRGDLLQHGGRTAVVHRAGHRSAAACTSSGLPPMATLNAAAGEHVKVVVVVADGHGPRSRGMPHSAASTARPGALVAAARGRPRPSSSRPSPSRERVLMTRTCPAQLGRRWPPSGRAPARPVDGAHLQGLRPGQCPVRSSTAWMAPTVCRRLPRYRPSTSLTGRVSWRSSAAVARRCRRPWARCRARGTGATRRCQHRPRSSTLQASWRRGRPPQTTAPLSRTMGRSSGSQPECSSRPADRVQVAPGAEGHARARPPAPPPGPRSPGAAARRRTRCPAACRPRRRPPAACPAPASRSTVSPRDDRNR